MSTAVSLLPVTAPAAATPDVWLAAPTSEDTAATFSELLALLTGPEVIDAPAGPANPGEVTDQSTQADEGAADLPTALLGAAVPQPPAAPATTLWPSGLERALVLTLRTTGAGVQVVQAATPPPTLPMPPAAPATPLVATGPTTLAEVEATAAPIPVDRTTRPQMPQPVLSDGAVAWAPTTGQLDGPGAAAEGVLRLPADRAELWKRPLAQALGERLQFQAANGVDQARIRLDPPTLGRIEILLRQEGNQLQVQLTASHPEVARQLHLMGDGLRQELSVRQGLQVSVQVHDSSTPTDGRSQQQQRQQSEAEAEDTPGHALRSESQAGASAFTLG